MKKLNTLGDAIRTVLKHCSKRANTSTQGGSVYTVPCVAYATVRCREYIVVRRRKVIDRF